MRKLTVTVTRTEWETFEVEVPDDFDTAADYALEDLVLELDPGDSVDGATTFLECVLDADEIVTVEVES